MSDKPRVPLHYLRRHRTEPVCHLAYGDEFQDALCGAEAPSGWTRLGYGLRGKVCPVCAQAYWGHEPPWVVRKYEKAVLDRVEEMRDALGDEKREYPVEVQNVIGRFEMLEEVDYER